MTYYVIILYNYGVRLFVSHAHCVISIHCYSEMRYEAAIDLDFCIQKLKSIAATIASQGIKNIA